MTVHQFGEQGVRVDAFVSDDDALEEDLLQRSVYGAGHGGPLDDLLAEPLQRGVNGVGELGVSLAALVERGPGEAGFFQSEG